MPPTPRRQQGSLTVQLLGAQLTILQGHRAACPQGQPGLWPASSSPCPHWPGQGQFHKGRRRQLKSCGPQVKRRPLLLLLGPELSRKPGCEVWAHPLPRLAQDLPFLKLPARLQSVQQKRQEA